jgi:hypothetical protein
VPELNTDPVLLRHSWRIARHHRRSHDLCIIRPAEARHLCADHILKADPRQTELARPAARPPPLFPWLAWVSPVRLATPAALRARDGIFECPAAHAARGTEYD